MTGYGGGFETEMFTEPAGENDLRRLVAVVAWKTSRGSVGAPPVVATMMATQAPPSLPRKVALGAAFAVLALPVYILDCVGRGRRWWKERQALRAVRNAASIEYRTPEVTYSPERRTVRVNGREFQLPDGRTLVLLVEDVVAPEERLAIAEHTIVTEARGEVRIDPADRERLRTTRDREMRREIMKRIAAASRGGEAGWLFSLMRDPTYAAFVERAHLELKARRKRTGRAT